MSTNASHMPRGIAVARFERICRDVSGTGQVPQTGGTPNELAELVCQFLKTKCDEQRSGTVSAPASMVSLVLAYVERLKVCEEVAAATSDSQVGADAVITWCGDEPPVVHGDEVIDLEVYEPTIIDSDEVGE